MAIDGFTVNGTALVYTGTGGAGALELLGYTDRGVRVRWLENTEPIFTDVFGPLTPHDFQDMGMAAEITAPLIAMDRTILGKIQGKGDRTTLGMISTPGLVKGQAGYAFKVAIAAPLDTPWTFVKAILRPGLETELATKANPFVVSFFTWPYAAFTVTAGKDTVLWNRVLS